MGVYWEVPVLDYSLEFCLCYVSRLSYRVPFGT